MRPSIRAAIVLAGLLLSACGPSVVYAPIKEPTTGPRRADQVQIVMEGSLPGCHAEAIGVVQGKSWESGYTPGSPAESIRTLQLEAARHGAHGIMDLKCQEAEQIGSPYQCVGTAFVCDAVTAP